MNAAFLPLVALLGLLALAALAWPARRVASGGTSTLIETTRRPTALTRRIGAGALLVAALGVGLGLARGPSALESADKNEADAAKAAAIAQVQARVVELKARVAAQPDDATSWEKLGLSEAALGHPVDALAAMRRAQALKPDDPNVLAETALARLVADPGSAGGEPSSLVARALRIDPANRKALALAGTLALQRKDYATAVARWEALAQLEPADSAIGRQIQAGLAEARKRTNVVGTSATKTSATTATHGTTATTATPATTARTATTATADTVAAASTPARIDGTVSLAVGLRGRVEPDDTLFVYARIEGTPGPPLAVLRRHVRDLPLAFTLDDTLAIDGMAPLSSASRVVVVARISKSGQAIEHAGDLEGRLASVAVGSRAVRLEIDSTVPARR